MAMTRDEQHQLIGEVVSRLADAKRAEACIHEKTDNVLADLHAVHQLLARNRTGSFAEGKFRISEPDGSTRECRLPSSEDVAALIDDLNEARETVDRLEQRRSAMGV